MNSSVPTGSFEPNCTLSFAPDPHFSESQQVELYANNSNYQWDGAMKIFELYRFKGNERVLDIGCGPGDITYHLCQQRTQGRVHGLDISALMIERASQTYHDPRLTFSSGDMTAFTVADKYDVVYAGYSLQYGDAKKALTCIFESLNPGGAVLITMPGKFDGSLAANSDRIARSEKWKDDFREFKNTRRYYDSDEFARLLQQVGFIPNRVAAHLQKVEFPDQKSIEAFYLPVSAHARHLPEFRRAEFISDLISQVLNGNPVAKDEKPFIYQNKLEVIAIKPLSGLQKL